MSERVCVCPSWNGVCAGAIIRRISTPRLLGLVGWCFNGPLPGPSEEPEEATGLILRTFNCVVHALALGIRTNDSGISIGTGDEHLNAVILWK